MAPHPYDALPSYCFWRQSIVESARAEVDPVVRPKFTIRRSDRVATAGSCFAQHIARQLSKAGFTYLVTETAHPVVAGCDTAKYNYGVFTARYGNIYTSRQLVQLLKRVYGRLFPDDDVWQRPDGRLVDPFRPQIQPNGFASMAEYQADREQHFAAVRRAIETLDIMVFTLGLTETWICRTDGAAYPLCPGVAGGEFSEHRYGFLNLTVTDVVTDLGLAIDIIRSKNSGARFILTVSPVPLIATAEDRSVLVSTTYSKSVLRVAAEEVATHRPYVAYFPSYEIITGNHARGHYFENDLRSVNQAGIEHVMRLFIAHYGDSDNRTSIESAGADALPFTDAAEAAAQISAIMCDEEALARE